MAQDQDGPFYNGRWSGDNGNGNGNDNGNARNSGMGSFGSGSINLNDSFRDLFGGTNTNTTHTNHNAFGGGGGGGGGGGNNTGIRGVNINVGGGGGCGDVQYCGGLFGGTDHSGGGGGAATNITPSNQVIAKQCDFFDTAVADEQRRKQHNIFQRNFFGFSLNSSNSKDHDDQQQVQEEEEDYNKNTLSDLSRRVNSLSITERQQAQNDVYGYQLNHDDEDPIQLKSWLKEMDVLIEKGISGGHYSTLQLAIHTDNSNNGIINNTNSTIGAEYVKSQRIKFLRASDWQVHEAVKRMARFFDIKLECFGSECLARDLTLNDLTDLDKSLWERYGFIQLAEERDAYGRAILVVMGAQQCKCPVDSVARVILYITMILAKDETIQKTGFVNVVWGHGQPTIVTRRATRIIETLRSAPLRQVGIHLCYENNSAQRIFSIIAKMALTWGAVRTRTHQGTSMECAYSLMSYGIPRNAIPVNNDGVVEFDFFHSFLDAIEKQEHKDRQNIRAQQQTDPPLEQHIQQLKNNRSQFDQQQQQQTPSYQRFPPMMSIDEKKDNGNSNDGQQRQQQQRSSFLSWDMSELDPLSIGGLDAFNLDDLPDDLVNRLALLQNSNTSSNIGAVATTTAMEISNGTDQNTPTAATASTHNNNIQLPTSNTNVTTHQYTSTTIAAAQRNSGSGSGSGNSTSASVSVSASVSASEEVVFVPGPLDVIMGRGRHNQKKPGNRKLNLLLESYAEEYEASDKFQKTVLSEVFVSKMKNDGSRFLIREGDRKKHSIWVEVSLEKARDKVAHDFRNLRRNAKIALKNAAEAEVAAVSSAASVSDTNSESNMITSLPSKRRRSKTSSTYLDQEHGDSKRTHGILPEGMGTQTV